MSEPVPHPRAGARAPVLPPRAAAPALVPPTRAAAPAAAHQVGDWSRHFSWLPRSVATSSPVKRRCPIQHPFRLALPLQFGSKHRKRLTPCPSQCRPAEPPPPRPCTRWVKGGGGLPGPVPCPGCSSSQYTRTTNLLLPPQIRADGGVQKGGRAWRNAGAVRGGGILPLAYLICLHARAHAQIKNAAAAVSASKPLCPSHIRRTWYALS